MDSEHALCRYCGNVVRTDWESCFHCGRRHPVSTPIGTTVLHVSAILGTLAVVSIVALNASDVWSALQQAPNLMAREAPVRAATVGDPAQIVVPTAAGVHVATTGAGLAGAAALGVAQGGNATVAAPLPPTTSTGAVASAPATTSTGDVSRSDPGASSARLDADVTARRIRDCETIADLDSLETRLREQYPDDPTLAVGGRIWRQLKSRRAALSLR